MKDLREYLGFLESRGKLRRIKNEVDKDWEIGCMARWVYHGLPEEKRVGLLFENIKGYPKAKVVTACYAPSQNVYAMALGTTPDPPVNIYEKWVHADRNKMKPAEVPRSSAPVKEVVLKGNDVNLLALPIPIFAPGRDIGPYVTAPCVISKDIDTGIQNVGTYRMEVRSKNETGLLILPYQDIGVHYFEKAQPRNKPLEVAVAIGTSPSIMFASTAKYEYGVDELEIAGGLDGSPVPVVKGETVDLMVPATAEYVIEGEIPPQVRELEGPYGEYTGYMGIPTYRTIIRVKCITHRKDPIFYGLISQIPPSESSQIRTQSWSSILYRRLVHDLRETAVKDVYITQSSGSWGHIIVSMRPVFPGHAKNIGELCSALLHATAGKIVTVVNDDIDVRDPFMVDWAVTFRCDPARDVTLLPNCTAPELDPSVGNVAGVVPTEKRILGSKMIIDATIKSEYPPCSAPSARYMYKALESWKAAGLPEFEVSSNKKLFFDKHPEEEIIVKPYAFVEEEKAIPVAAVEWWQRSYDRYFHAEDGKFGLKKPIGEEKK